MPNKLNDLELNIYLFTLTLFDFKRCVQIYEFAKHLIFQYYRAMKKTASTDSHTALQLFFITLLFFLAFLPPLNYSIDGNSMLGVAESLVSRGTFAVSPELGAPGKNGLYYSIWYPFLSILEVPFVFLGHTVAKLMHAPHYSHFFAEAFALVLSALLGSTLAVQTFLLSRLLGAMPRSALLASVGCIFGTCFLVYCRTLFADPLVAVLVTLGVYWTLSNRSKGTGPIAAVNALVFLTKPTGILLGPVLTFYPLIKYRNIGRAFCFVLGTAAGFALYMIYNQLRFGSPLSFGTRPQILFAYFPIGMIRNLFSPGLGILIYNPALWLTIPAFFTLFKRGRAETLQLLLVCFAFLFIYSCWPVSGFDWGTRHLLAIVPICFAVIGTLLNSGWRKAFIGLTLLGFVVNAPTLVSFYELHFMEAVEQGIPNENIIWNFKDAPVTHGWSAAYRQVQNAVHNDPKALMKESTTPSKTRTRVADALVFKIIPTWWWMTPALGMPKALGYVTAALMLICSFVLGWRLFRVV
jgi:hypothetical protein